MENVKLQYIGAMNYKLEIPESRLYYPQTGGVMKMLEVKRNDRRSLSCIVRDNFGRPLNLKNADIKFVLRSKDSIMGPDGDVVIIADQEVISILDQTKHQNLGEFHVSIQDSATESAGTFMAEFQIQAKGILESRKTPSYALADEDTLIVSVDGEEQTVTFSQQDFVDITAATVAELIVQINDQLDGATAYPLKINEHECYFFIVSDANQGSVQMAGGTAGDILGLNNQIHKDQRITLPGEGLMIVIREDLDEAEVLG